MWMRMQKMCTNMFKITKNVITIVNLDCLLYYKSNIIMMLPMMLQKISYTIKLLFHNIIWIQLYCFICRCCVQLCNYLLNPIVM